MEKKCTTCYHHYHNKHTMTICRHALMCNNHDKWEPYTNGDWIRTANDDELARFLTHVAKFVISDDNHFKWWVQERKENDDEGI